MATGLLLPNRYKFIGWCLLIPATIIGIILSFKGFGTNWLNAKVFAIFPGGFLGESQPFSFIETDLTNTIVGVIFIAGAMFVGISKEKREDEYIEKIRLSSLLWAVKVNYILLLLAVLFVYGTALALKIAKVFNKSVEGIFILEKTD